MGGGAGGPGGCGAVVGLRGMNTHLVPAHGSGTHWTSRPASRCTENLKKGGRGRRGPAIALSGIFARVLPRLAVRSFTTRSGTGGSWIESQRPLRAQETQTVASTQHRAQEDEHNAHRPPGWVRVTVRQRAPVPAIHSHAARLDAGVMKQRLEPPEQTLIDI